MQILDIASPLSGYLHTHELHFLQVWKMVEIAKEQIMMLMDSFSHLKILVE